MQYITRYIAITLLSWASCLGMGQVAHAHLMVAQHGTLNIVGDGVFMVLSLPISAFDGVDDNSDGKISMVEFNHHRGAIVESVRRNVVLIDRQGRASLQGIMLSPVASHDLVEQSISQLTVLGRFTLNNPASTLHFHAELFGTQADEQSLEITAMRRSDSQKAVFELTRVNRQL